MRILILFIGLSLLFPLASFADSDITSRLSGRILLQVEDSGEAWYVNPVNKNRYFLGRPSDAFRVMRELGLGISEKNFNSFNGVAPKNLSGRILLRVEANGEAYYVNPVDLKLHFLNRPADAFSVMRNLGLGITNSNLQQINANENYWNNNSSNENISNEVTNNESTNNENQVISFTEDARGLVDSHLLTLSDAIKDCDELVLLIDKRVSFLESKSYQTNDDVYELNDIKNYRDVLTQVRSIFNSKIPSFTNIFNILNSDIVVDYSTYKGILEKYKGDVSITSEVHLSVKNNFNILKNKWSYENELLEVRRNICLSPLESPLNELPPAEQNRILDLRCGVSTPASDLSYKLYQQQTYVDCMLENIADYIKCERLKPSFY